ncbi:uncharacterized protein LOC127265241 [Andrographis paniculata]|uniref:uncharacterized protein LOC127265241 n=1 Tax=Andrographis paniculata TaxID=175694 RepID=UPI0021E742DC|nr:uncharacterized protein LOC127265241 [Andrographis paniculata]
MELDLGIKLTRVADEFTSDFQLTKDRAGPVFLSHETDSMFILTAHLKGYRRRNIEIDINEDGTLIGLSGEQQVKETVIVGGKVYKKDVETKGFKKVFRIPDGVILDMIKAKFNNESTLTITMPKKVKGIRGTTIEEIKENQGLVKEGSGSLQIAVEKVQKIDEMSSEANAKLGKEKQVEAPSVSNNSDEKDDDDQKEKEQEDRKTMSGMESFPSREVPPEEDKQAQKLEPEIQEINETAKDEDHDQQKIDNQDHIREGETESEETAEGGPGTTQQPEHRPREKKCKMCIPIIAGSTLLLSLVVFVFQIIRSKNQTSRRRS